MRIAVQPKYVGNEPSKGLLNVEISVMPDPALDEEEAGLRKFLDQVKKNEVLEIIAPHITFSNLSTKLCLQVSGRDLAVDW